MKVKIYYRITQDRAGLSQDFSGAQYFSVGEGQAVEEMARQKVAGDYQIPASSVEISRVEH